MTRPSAPPVAYVGLDRQLHVISAEGGPARQVSFPAIASELQLWGGATGKDSCSWPTWSPDGRWLAFFRALSEGDAPVEVDVCVLEVDGVEERQLTHLSDGLPLYASWNRSGDALAVLVQRGEELELRTCRPDAVGEHRVVDEGPPLFFSWLPDGSRLLIHAGGQGGKRVVVRDALGVREDAPMPGEPGTFCAPMVVGEEVLYARANGTRSTLIRAHPDGSDPRALWEVDGLIAFVPSPDQSLVAFGSVDHDRGPYDGVSVMPLDGSSEPRRVIDHPCLAFAWLPDGQGLLSATIDEERKCLWWHLHLLASGDERRLCPFRPTREMMFQLHFFEQFVQTHPLISPDGRWLIQATFPNAADGPDAPSGPPRIEILDLSDPRARPRLLAHGRFATFGPPGLADPSAAG